jgi:hypothetical protein
MIVHQGLCVLSTRQLLQLYQDQSESKYNPYLRFCLLLLNIMFNVLNGRPYKRKVRRTKLDLLYDHYKHKAIPGTGHGDVEDPTLSRQSAHRWQWGCQLHTPAVLFSPETFSSCFWYSFLLEAK